MIRKTGMRSIQSSVVAVTLGTLLLLAPSVEAAEGDLLWTDEVDFGGSWDVAFSIAPSGGVVFAAGVGSFSSVDAAALIRAYDAGTGRLLWSNPFDTAGETDDIRRLAAAEDRVFAAGITGDCAVFGVSDCDVLVLAYHGRTGALLWSDRFDVASGHDRAFDVAVLGDRIFVVGEGVNVDGNFDALIRAYDARTGEIAWSDQFDRDGSRDSLRLVAAGGNRVFGAGQGGRLRRGRPGPRLRRRDRGDTVDRSLRSRRTRAV